MTELLSAKNKSPQAHDKQHQIVNHDDSSPLAFGDLYSTTAIIRPENFTVW